MDILEISRCLGKEKEINIMNQKKQTNNYKWRFRVINHSLTHSTNSGVGGR